MAGDIKPITVLRRYQQEIWNDGKLEVLPEIVASPYRRHYPGKVETLSTDELAERIRYYRRGLHDISFHSVLEVIDGPLITTAWETNGYTRDGRHLCTAGIEIFKIEHGLITDVWNGHGSDGSWAWNVVWDRTVEPGDVVDVQGRIREWGVVTGRGTAGDGGQPPHI